jgi:hypothetical protein
MKLITFVFVTVWYFAHAQEEETSTFLRGAGGKNNVNVELAIVEEDVEQMTNVASNYGDDGGMNLHERQLQSLGDWAFCSSSSHCRNSWCSSRYSDDGRLKCTPVGGFKPDQGCVTTGGGGYIGENNGKKKLATISPTFYPTVLPTDYPTPAPVTPAPVTDEPTHIPTEYPTPAPVTPAPVTDEPTSFPTEYPTPAPVTPAPVTDEPTHIPTEYPTPAPVTPAPVTDEPTFFPTEYPTPAPVIFGDWEFCSSSSQCRNGCCSSRYSNDGKLKCTPVGGFKPHEGCII